MRPRARVASLLFFSGSAALIYQVAWLRELRLIFGASTAASAAVLAVFMAGLGAGGVVLGKRADLRKNALALYAQLEIAISLICAVTPFLVVLARKTYIGVGGVETLGATGGTLARLVLGALVLGAPTFLMGGTLPAAARAIETRADEGRRSVAVLYAANTFGAVTGAVLANFVLLEVFGNRMTLWLACLVNLLVGVLARGMSRGLEDETPREEPAEKSKKKDERPASSPPSFVLAAAGLVGFVFLLMELVWYRMLAPLLGGSSYSFGLILACALLGIGVGGMAYASGGDRRSPTMRAFALTCALEAFFLILPYAFGDRIALFALFLRPFRGFGFVGLAFVWTVVTSVVVVPAAIVSGYQFPLLIGLLGGGRKDVGRHVGNAYAANTAGAIAGSLAGGFGLVPLLTAPGTWRLAVAALVVLAIASAVLSLREEGASFGLAAPITGAALAGWMLFAEGPTAAWRHSPIGAGRADLVTRDLSENGLHAWRNAERSGLLWEADGVESAVALRGADGTAFILNGKSDGEARNDAPTQVFGGLLGAVLHGSAKRSLVIGLGTGSTAGWLGVVPGMERVDVVELEPVIARVAEACAPVNAGVMKNPNVHVTYGDAREVLLTTRQRYDVIFSEPSNPYRAGISSLYTREFYEAVSGKMSPGGIFLQWIQAYEVDARALRGALATLSSVFEDVSVWETDGGDFILVSTHAPIEIDADALRARVASEPYKTAMAHVWRTTGVEALLGHHVANGDLAKKVAAEEGDAINTDDRNLLEFAFARTVGQGAFTAAEELWKASRQLRLDHPLRVKGQVDWAVVDDRRATDPVARSMGNASRRNKLLGLLPSYFAGELGGVMGALSGELPEPGTLVEAEMLAEAMANTADPRAGALIDHIALLDPTEALALRGRLELHLGHFAESATAFEAAFTAYRTDPWPQRDVMRRSIDAARDLAARSPDFAPRMMRALEPSFSLHLLDVQRRHALVLLAKIVDKGAGCAKAFAQYEPFVPWERETLEGRFLCYARVKSPLAGVAEKELEELLYASPSTVLPEPPAETRAAPAASASH